MATPTVETSPATNITTSVARLQGKISNDRGATCEARFRYRRKLTCS